MLNEKICLASDNFAPAHPAILEAISKANSGFAPAYGSDSWTESASNLLQDVFGRKAKVLFVPSGTGSNVLGLKIACKRHESVICSDIAHIDYQESGAAESIVGCKLQTVPSLNGKILPHDVLKKLKRERAFGKHSTLPRVLSITQPTEVGTVYTLEELKALSLLCKEENLLLHMDASRLYNAAVFLKASLFEITQHVDVLSLGGSKNGLLMGEALLIFRDDLLDGADHLHKQTLQLVSKMRFFSSQFLAFFEENLWHFLASQANQKALQVAKILQKIPGISLSHPVETNQIFFTAPAQMISHIQEKIFCYLWDSDKGEIRFITSWNTSDLEINEIEKILLSISVSN